MQRPFRGFTLFELMAVVAVVAVVATAAVANMSEQIAEARAHADGQAMMQRIRLEHRNSKERMRGLVLKSTGAAHNILEFHDAKDCESTGTVRKVTFLPTTSLKITGETSEACWDEHGEPAGAMAAPPGGGGGSMLPGSPNVGGPITQPPPPFSMVIGAGIKQRRGTRVVATKAGVGPDIAVKTASVTANAGDFNSTAPPDNIDTLPPAAF